MVGAQAAARSQGHRTIDTAHLLAAITIQPSLVEALRHRGLDTESVEVRLLEERPERRRRPRGHIPLAEDSRSAIRRALSAADLRDTVMITPTHLLFGIAATPGPGAAILQGAGLRYDVIATWLDGSQPVDEDGSTG